MPQDYLSDTQATHVRDDRSLRENDATPVAVRPSRDMWLARFWASRFVSGSRRCQCLAAQEFIRNVPRQGCPTTAPYDGNNTGNSSSRPLATSPFLSAYIHGHGPPSPSHLGV